MIGLSEAFGGGATAPAAVDVGAIFAPEGDLVRALGLQHRPGQAMMAAAVDEALRGDHALLAEAGTGVGKSLAYLVPGIARAVLAKRPLVVSTHTISLQEQVRDDDLPKVRRLFRAIPALAPHADFPEALLLGRANYLCPRRLAAALAERRELFPSTAQADLDRVATWAATTKDGVRHELSPPPDPEVWDWVNADASACSPRHCSPETCFFRAARARLKEAKVVIVNHALLCTLVGAGAGPGGESNGVLVADDAVVIDEAHTLPEVATDHFGLALSSYGLERLLRRLYHPTRKKGLLARLGSDFDVRAAMEAQAAADVFFALVREQHLTHQALVRLRAPGWGPGDLAPALTALTERLADLIERMPDGTGQDELKDFKGRVQAWGAGLKEALDVAEADHVYWLERSGRRHPVVTIRSAPLDVAKELRSRLFSRGVAVVLASATLGPGDGLPEAFSRAVGAHDAAMLVAPSPFDYPRQVRTFVATDCPNPGQSGGRLDREWLASMVRRCALACDGGSLVLFTSHADLQAVAEEIAGPLAAAGRPLFIQGGGASRHQLRRDFAAAGNGVLLGTDSFWTGIDVPGRALAQVILTRLPFEAPGHPVTEARADRLREAGREPFVDLFLPAALVTFRQGVGRLIRSMTDTGTITLLDSRLLTKPYGKRFLNALPHPAYTRFSAADFDEVFKPL